uniref:Transmembrane protein 220 n=1 Tax=Strix occidentalis caurina TaxID=311401 RepID=A0A8D0EFE0_STROC
WTWKTTRICGPIQIFHIICISLFKNISPQAEMPSVLLIITGKTSGRDNGVWRSLCDLHSAGCIVGTIALARSLFAYAQGNILHEEEGRELFGLVIITIWMSLCRSSAKSPLGGVRLIAALLVALFPFVSWLYIYVNKEMRASWPTHCKTVI